MRGALIESLQKKGEFELKQAVAIAEALDMSAEVAPSVTGPVFDARVAELEDELEEDFACVYTRIGQLESRINVRMFLLGWLLVLVNLANGPVGVAVFDAIRRFLWGKIG